MNVLCNLIVMMCFNADCTGRIEAKATGMGKIRASSQTQYVVNFSETAKQQNWAGDYSTVLVKKTECVRMD